jgi:hypothetical protein
MGTRRNVVKAIFNRVTFVQALVLACGVLLATSAFAANKGSVQLMHPTQVAGKQLAPGSYKIQWEGSGEQVQLSIMQGNKEVASTTARVVQIQPRSPNDNALITVGADGTRSLSQIRFRGKTFALDLGGEGSGSGSSGSGR